MGGHIVTRFTLSNERLQLNLVALSGLAFILLNIALYMSSEKYTALSLLAISSLVGMIGLGPVFAIVQGLVEEKMRALTVAILYLIINFIGLGLGPLTVGFLSDSFVGEYGQLSLRYASLIVLPIYLWACIHLWLASISVSQNLTKTDIFSNKDAIDP